MKHRMRTWLGLLALGLTLLAGRSAQALESDQFTLPPQPLADLAPEFDKHLNEQFDLAIAKANAKLLELRDKLADTPSEYWKKYFRKEIEKHSQPRELAGSLQSIVGIGMPSPTIERWVVEHTFEAQPAKFAVGYGDSIFGASALFKPLLVVAMAPTVRIHGVEMGTDKVGHVLQQGYEYYTVYDKHVEKGQSQEGAVKAAVRAGVGKEKSVYGKWWTGVVSNADLAANYAGLKFYINLTQPVKLNDRTLPPLVVMRDGLWVRNEAAGHFIEVFITEHFSEAINPSMYDGPVRAAIRNALRKRGEAWVLHHQTDREAEVKRLERMTTFFGEDYGHEGGENLVTIVNGYFDVIDSEQKQADARSVAADQKNDTPGTN